MINQIEKGTLAIFFFQILFVSSFTTSSASFGKFDIQNVILFQIKVFGRNIKETTLARFFAYIIFAFYICLLPPTNKRFIIVIKNYLF